jgi:two-component system, LytTR family, response regulator
MRETAPESLRALIVDDEQLARDRLRMLLQKEPDILLLGECASGQEAREALQRLEVDLLFLDVQMPEVDGFQVLEGFAPERLPVVVFVTAHDRYAMRAFEVRALDYLLKPFDVDRFRATLQWARDRVRRDRRHALNAEVLAALDELRARKPYPERLVVKDGGKLTFVRVAELDYVEAAGNYVSLQCGAQSHLMRQTMAETEAQLDPARFVRIHRSTIVNVERIRSLEPLLGGDYAVQLEDGRRLTLSRSHRDRLKEWLGGAA